MGIHHLRYTGPMDKPPRGKYVITERGKQASKRFLFTTSDFSSLTLVCLITMLLKKKLYHFMVINY